MYFMTINFMVLFFIAMMNYFGSYEIYITYIYLLSLLHSTLLSDC